MEVWFRGSEKKSNSLVILSVEWECKNAIFLFCVKNLVDITGSFFLFAFFFLFDVVCPLPRFFFLTAIRTKPRVFLDCCLRFRASALYPEPFIISAILLAAFLFKFFPDFRARPFTASLKCVPLFATSSKTLIPAQSVYFPTAFTPLEI